MNLVSPSNCFSTPPLKKNVTWAYFSVSDKKKSKWLPTFRTSSKTRANAYNKHQVKIFKLETLIKKHFLLVP